MSVKTIKMMLPGVYNLTFMFIVSIIVCNGEDNTAAAAIKLIAEIWRGCVVVW